MDFARADTGEIAVGVVALGVAQRVRHLILVIDEKGRCWCDSSLPSYAQLPFGWSLVGHLVFGVHRKLIQTYESAISLTDTFSLQ